MKNIFILGILIFVSGNRSLAADEIERSLQCKLFETASGKLLTMGGAFPKTQSGSPDEIERSDFALVINRTAPTQPSIVVINKQKKSVISAEFEMGKKESFFSPFKLRLANEKEGLRLDCAWQ